MYFYLLFHQVGSITGPTKQSVETKLTCVLVGWREGLISAVISPRISVSRDVKISLKFVKIQFKFSFIGLDSNFKFIINLAKNPV